MSDSTFLPYDIVPEMEKYHSGYQSLIRIGDTENPRDLTRIFVKNDTINDFEISLEEFNGYNGILSSGKEISMNNFFSESYFKFKSNLNLVKQYTANIKESYKTVTKSVREYVDGDYVNVTKQVSSEPLYSLDETLKNESYSFLLYMNGEKLPDTEIYYNNNVGGSTDIFIPKRYIDGVLKDGGTIRFDIEERAPGNENIYYYNNNYTGSSLTINMDDPTLRYIDDGKPIEVKDICVYNDKKFVNNVSSVTKDDVKRTIVITFNGPVTGELELYIRNNIVYRRENDNFIDNSNDTTLQLFIDDDYMFDTLNGPVPKHAISFFYNGLKVYDKEIKQTSRFSYSYTTDGSTLYYDNIDFYVEDREILIDDESFSIYGPDYYLLNMLGVKRSVDRLEGNLTNSIFDDPKYFLDFSDTLSDKETLFDTEYQLNDFNYMENTFFNNEDKIKYMISKKPHILRELLSKYATKSKFYVINGNTNNVKISSVEPITDTSKEVLYSVFINTLLVSDILLTVERVNDIDIITIDKTLLNPGLNTVELVQYNQVKKPSEYYSYITPTTNLISQVNIPLTTLGFQEGFTLEDIVILKKISNDDYYIYANDTSTGYIPFKEYSTEILLYPDMLTINFDGDNYPEGFIVIDKDFSYTYTVDITDTTGMNFDEEDVILPLVTDMSVPLINDNVPEVYHNGRLLTYSEEYGYKTPFDNEKLACSVITLKVFYDYGDVFRIVFNNTEINVLMTYSDIEIKTRYGLLYLEDLPFPFSPDYLDITVNGNKLTKYNIDLLSDKLIRIKGITNPIRSLTVSTKFGVTMGELKPYIDEYWLTPFEKLMSMMFYNVNPKNEFNSLYPVTDYIYEQFDENVDSVQKMPNPDESEDSAEGGLDLLIVMYIRWLYFSKDVRTYVFSDQDVNADVLRFFKLFKEDLVGNRFDIIVDCSKEYVGLGQDAIKLIEEYPGSDFMYTNSFMWDTILDISKNNEGVKFNEIFDYLKVHPNMNILYPQDLPLTFEYSGGIRPSGKEQDILNFDPKDSVLVEPGPTRSDYFFSNSVLYYQPDPNTDPDKFTGIYDGNLYFNGTINNEYRIFNDTLYLNGSVASGEHYYKYNLYIDGVKKIDGGYEIINNRLFNNGLVYNGEYLGDSKLYINGVIPIGFYDYNGRISYKGDWFTGTYIDDKLYIDGYTTEGYYIYEGKLYYNGKYNIGYVLYEDKLYYNENYNIGYVLYEDKLYYDENYNIGYFAYDDKLYFNDTLYIIDKEIELNGHFYYNGNLIDNSYRIIDDKLYKDDEFFENVTQKMFYRAIEKSTEQEFGILFVDGLIIENPLFPETLEELEDILKDPSLNFTSSDSELPDLKHIYTGHITTFENLFLNRYGVTNLDGLRSWDTSNVVSLYRTFASINFYNDNTITSIEGLRFWNTSNVTDMSHLFRQCINITNLSSIENWDTSNVTNMTYMFYGCGSLKNVSVFENWNTESLNNVDSLFLNCTSLTDISGLRNLNMNKLNSLYGLFNNCQSLTDLSPISNWNISNVTDTGNTFSGCTSLIDLTPISNWNTGKVINMVYMFANCTSLISADLSGWDTSSLTSMFYLFKGCTSLISADLSGWNTSKVTSMTNLFYNCNSLTSLNVSHFNTSNVTDISNMFRFCRSLATLDISNFDTSGVTNMDNLFSNCNSLTSLDVSNFNTSNVTDMSGMFTGCNSLTSLDLSHFNTSKVVNMSYMFYKCNSLTSLDISHFNTSNVTDMMGTFEECELLTSLNISNLNTSKVINMSYMFANCISLTSLDVSNFDTINVTDMYAFTFNCEKMSSIDLSGFNMVNVKNASSMFFDCVTMDNPSILSMNNWILDSVTNMDNIFAYLNIDSYITDTLASWKANTENTYVQNLTIDILT